MGLLRSLVLPLALLGGDKAASPGVAVDVELVLGEPLGCAGIR
jgi:hypothetical protein